MDSTDFVSIIEGLAGFVQNERVAAYNDGFNQAVKHIKDWIREQQKDPSGDNIPDLLDNFMSDLSRDKQP